MSEAPRQPRIENEPTLMITLGWYAAVGGVVFVVSILIADFVVPEHDWIADTISDLGAGRFEYIVDIGLYSLSASFIALALLAAHVHMGGWGWSVGIVGLAVLGLVVFLVGARNEYGDSDNDGWVIHSYLVYLLGLLMALIPALLHSGARRASATYGNCLVAVGVMWTISAPWFFFLPTTVDGLYERYLGLIALALIFTLSHFFIRHGRAFDDRR
ncbi:DUF998 domain-containing protein [Marivita sp.]|uniref:DUF998 domain-containing protein n=1 Tax=Marivita sp. TaxID=2003365 RepID=UPI0025C1FF0D|nr:DUF998 domain-containing protein [Marivita sp.]